MRTHRLGDSAARAGSAFWLVVAWAALDGAVATYIQINGVNATSTSLLVTAAAAFGVAVAVSGRRVAAVEGLLLALVIVQLALRVVIPYQPGSPSSEWSIPALALIALALALMAIRSRHPTSSHRRVQACLLGVAILGLLCRAAVVMIDPYPTFDVPLVQEAAAAAIRAGGDPYLTHVYLPGYPYLPVAAIGAAAGSLFGDARWGVVAGDAMTMLGLVILARRCRAPLLLGPTLAALWAWWAGALFVVWQGFPEPMLLGLLTLGVAASVGPLRRLLLAGILLGTGVATKQFGLAVLPYLLRFRDGRRILLVALATALLIVGPFALWHTRDFFEGSFWSLLDTPGRDYALNLLVWPNGRLEPPYLPILAVALVAGWLVSRRFDRAGVDAGWVAGTSTLLMIAFLLNRIAFINYYSLLMLFLLLLVTILSAGAPGHRAGPGLEQAALTGREHGAAGNG